MNEHERVLFSAADAVGLITATTPKTVQKTKSIEMMDFIIFFIIKLPFGKF